MTKQTDSNGFADKCLPTGGVKVPDKIEHPENSKEILHCLHNNEDGDAELFIKLFKDKCCYDHASGLHYYWNDNWWRLDKNDHIYNRVNEVTDLYTTQMLYESYAKQVAKNDGQESKEKQHKLNEKMLRERIKLLHTLHRKRNIITLASKGLNSLGITGEEWDQKPMILGCRNGCIDLERGIFQDGVPSDYIKSVSPVEWITHEESTPMWDKFLMEMFSNDAELVGYIQRLLGYGVSGLNTEHVFPVFLGAKGRNGKGTLFETLKYILGDLAFKAPSNFLMDQRGMKSNHDAVTIGLYGKRLIWCSESNESDRLDVAKLKQLVGGDTLSARGPYARRVVEFTPTHLLLIITNRTPKAPSNDLALWRRIHLIPLNNSFVDDPDPANPNEFLADKNLLEKLRKEASGILAWLVRGCLLWQEFGLLPPDKINNATKDYRDAEDILGHFLQECCYILNDSTLRVKPKDLYNAYKEWCKDSGHHAMAKSRFLTDMKDRFKMVKITGTRYFSKVGMRHDV